MDKISVKDYINNRELLEITYLPFDRKMEIVSHVLNGVIQSVGGLNTSLLRLVSTEVFIEAVSNIDLSIEDENGLKGFDQLCFNNKLHDLENDLAGEYAELRKILDERTSDYIRIETNPAVTINTIYSQIKDGYNKVMDFISNQIQNIDVDELIKYAGTVAPQINDVVQRVGDQDES